MLKKEILLVFIAVLVLSGCSSKSDYILLQTEQNLSKENVKISARSIEYLILPQDRLLVSLYRDPEQGTIHTGSLGQEMNEKGTLVNAKGYIPLPLIGNIKVSGLTQTQAANKITKHFKKYLNTPSVYVEVMNKKLLVLGEVKNPGVIPIDKEKMTLFEALVHAGDFTDSAVKDSVIIVSNTKNGMQMRTVDLTNFDTMNYASLMLRPNDIVYVKPNGWKEFKVTSSDVLSPLDPILKLAGAFATFKYLLD